MLLRRETFVAHMHEHNMYAAVHRAITKRGLYVLPLIRVAPYPYNVGSYLA